MIYKLLKKFNRQFGYRHWYQVTYYYKDKSGRLVFDYTAWVGILYKPDIAISRIVKQTRPLHEVPELSRRFLCNGTLEVKVDVYLGWFSIASVMRPSKNP